MSDKDRWYRLDNAAKIFPAASTSSNTATFRVSVTLTEAINAKLLQEALDKVITRFPAYAVRIRKGLFWYYFEHNDKRLIIQEEVDSPCHKIDKYSNNRYLIKVLYYKNRISVEIFHSLTDGTGALEFLKTLTYEYLKRIHTDIKHEDKILLIEDTPSKYEIEDSFQRYYQPSDTPAIKDEDAYQIEGKPFVNFGNNVIHGVIDSMEFKRVVKSYGATMTEYIVALLIYSIYNENMKYGIYTHPISISVPVNLRGIFPSRTLRNFFTVINISVKVDKDMTLDEIIKETSRQLKYKVKKENLYPRIAENIKFEKLLIARFVPLWVKNIVMKYAFERANIKKTSSVTNLGKIMIPESIEKYVERVDVILYSTASNPLNCSICSVKHDLSITFSRTIVQTEIIKHFFSYLSKEEGLNVDIYTNEWGMEDEAL
ncbi:alcohol acetyltransferase [Clostridiaceae bacterium M8S5]|nr:alcohol acetyltransferase [Clostridiaceae bacterium M8S5]